MCKIFSLSLSLYIYIYTYVKAIGLSDLDVSENHLLPEHFRGIFNALSQAGSAHHCRTLSEEVLNNIMKKLHLAYKSQRWINNKLSEEVLVQAISLSPHSFQEKVRLSPFILA